MDHEDQIISMDSMFDFMWMEGDKSYLSIRQNYLKLSEAYKGHVSEVFPKKIFESPTQAADFKNQT